MALAQSALQVAQRRSERRTILPSQWCSHGGSGGFSTGTLGISSVFIRYSFPLFIRMLENTGKHFRWSVEKEVMSRNSSACLGSAAR